MPKASTTSKTSSVQKTVNISAQEYEDMKNRTERLEKMLEQLLAKQAEPVQAPAPAQTMTYAGNKKDTPCTLIHLRNCFPDLPTTININGITHYFTSFGEMKTFTWSDMSNIVSKYRSWFTRGVFALGADCEQFANELPADITALKLPESFYRTMATLPNDEFEKDFNSLTQSQKIQVANVWKMRYQNKERGYNDIEKVKIMNKATNGLLKSVMSDINSQ